MDLSIGFENSKKYFNSDRTLSYEFRLDKLRKLEYSIRKHQDDIFKALRTDLNKTVYESFMTEVGMVYAELREAKRNLRRWMHPKRGRVSLGQMPSMGFVYARPYGVVLIMSPWNYPFQLTLVPLIGAICAGNCVFVKPSAYSPATSTVIKEIITDVFNEDYVMVVEGGRKANGALLDLPFDYIFFTGSQSVGRKVMEAASKCLTPVTLELGGKSPCIVDATADLKKTAKRLIFGKMMNSGQTCVAPDYLLVEKSVKDKLIKIIKNTYAEMFPNEEYFLSNTPKIINEKHFKRICGLFEDENYWMGMKGRTYPDTRQIPLTIIDGATRDSKAMGEEIFGPVLPVVTWGDPEEAIRFIRAGQRPLALYLFTKSAKMKKDIVERVNFGGGTINDTLMHIASSGLPFGGVGESGMGSYHGKQSFDTFSHKKSVLRKSWYFDLPIRHHPFRKPDGKMPGWLF